MPFGRIERVEYKSSPLTQVVCQLRFPTLLELSAQLPTDFQKTVRSTYPLLSVVQNFTLQVGAGSNASSAAPSPTYRFTTMDGTFALDLAMDSLSLSTTNYDGWPNFRLRIEDSLRALLDLYGPMKILRLGLRYQNFIDRQKFGLEDYPWSKLINPDVLGVLKNTEFSEASAHVTQTVARIQTKLPGVPQFVVLQTGLNTNAETEKQAFIIDVDYYAEPIASHPLDAAVQSIVGALDEFNSQANGLFRWCISDDLDRKLSQSLA